MILEAQYIKEKQPKYNTKDKDNKSYNYVVITKEDFPRVLVVRGRNLNQGDYKYVFGPYPYGGELKEALKLVRKIFPFRDKCIPYSGGLSRPCFNRSIGLCPGVCTGEISKRDYGILIRNIKLFFEGKKSVLLKSLENQMKTFAKLREFEKAGEIKKSIFALNHIQDVSLMKRDVNVSDIRIEAYDIAHMSGKDMVGSMVVMDNGELNPGMYRKFVIKGFDKANDVGALEEIIRRRANHLDWGIPNIIVIDGNEVQLKRAYDTWFDLVKGDVLFCSVVKDDRHKARDVLFANRGKWDVYLKDNNILEKDLINKIIEINSEVHRFTIAFHKNRRAKTFLGN